MPVSHRGRGEKELLSKDLSGFDVTKEGRSQLKGHYCASESAAHQLCNFKQMILTLIELMFDGRDQDKGCSSCLGLAALQYITELRG